MILNQHHNLGLNMYLNQKQKEGIKDEEVLRSVYKTIKDMHKQRLKEIEETEENQRVRFMKIGQ